MLESGGEEEDWSSRLKQVVMDPGGSWGRSAPPPRCSLGPPGLRSLEIWGWRSSLKRPFALPSPPPPPHPAHLLWGFTPLSELVQVSSSRCLPTAAVSWLERTERRQNWGKDFRIHSSPTLLSLMCSLSTSREQLDIISSLQPGSCEKEVSSF